MPDRVADSDTSAGDSDADTDADTSAGDTDADADTNAVGNADAGSIQHHVRPESVY